MREIDSSLLEEEILFLFNKFDDDENGTIQFNEFKKWLEENKIRMTSKAPTKKVDKRVSVEIDSSPYVAPPPLRRASDQIANEAI